mmetsp:Transcript_8041/g.30176  ORF Transcript_8041/g.30176 Transcript_8041/m.30176 type:complete len:135 (+) Transcript_8041:296-700(+)
MPVSGVKGEGREAQACEGPRVTLQDGRELRLRRKPLSMSERGNTVEVATYEGETFVLKAVPKVYDTLEHQRQLEVEGRALTRLKGCAGACDARQPGRCLPYPAFVSLPRQLFLMVVFSSSLAHPRDHPDAGAAQ